MSTAVQIHCPFCNAAAAHQPGGQYTCEYCLQPFSVVDAQREETKLLDEIKRWIDQKVGAVGMGATGVDASSRAFIFRERIWPELQRDVNRALEVFGSYGQFALVQVPVRASGGPATTSASPLLAGRQQILGLKHLRARLASERVSEFAVGDDERARIQALDRRLADLMHLSNVADAAARADPAGYTAARRNLEALVGELGQSLAFESRGDPRLAAFLGALRDRYGALATLCRVCEDLCAAEYVQGDSTAHGLEQVASQLDAARQAIEASDYSPADAMPMAVGTGHEAIAVRQLARWVRSYEAVTRRRPMPFMACARALDGLTFGGQVPPEAQVELVEGCALALQAGRGEIALPVLNDFSWSQGWAEQTRAKKSLGFFGDEERLLNLQHFYVPVWVAEVTYSRSSGAVFASGVESRAVFLVDSCAPRADRVAPLQDGHPLLRALASPQAISTRDMALPRTTSGHATGVMQQALRNRPEFLNPRVRVTGLALAAAAVALLQSAKGQRTAVSCLNGMVHVDETAATQLRLAQQVFDQFG